MTTTSQSLQPDDSTDMFRPPVNRAMRILDRAFFQKDVNLAAACIPDKKNIATFLKDLHNDVVRIDRIRPVRTVPPNAFTDQNAKCLLLTPGTRTDDESSWSSRLQELVKARQVFVIPYHLKLDYSVWSYLDDIISAILPEDKQNEIPVGFSTAGHVAHLNLRDQYLPYKTLIASVLMDKNPVIRTVINKTDDVGEESDFRTFKYEVLAGPDEMNVEVREQDCVFKFDYSKVYWNSRLGTEHSRMVLKFQPGEAVCDVMAGVGPFAVPAAKNKVWVWANDLNPESHKSLIANAMRNKVTRFIRPSCADGRFFIRTAASRLLTSNRQFVIRPKPTHTAPPTERQSPSHRPKRAAATAAAAAVVLKEPKTFSHYILNLPASALTFLPAFIGLYAGREDLFHPHTEVKLPLIHIYCFSTKSDDNKTEREKICAEISRQLGCEIKVPRKADEGETEIYDVRDVSPQKRMFCATFRLPAEVAFRQGDDSGKELGKIRKVTVI
ncbi:MAG: hypothetical protein Q9182_006950 [Xanthomendoza sp. 2 TL-2023]